MNSKKENKGFIFVFNFNIDLKEYTNDNKKYYKDKILLHSLSTLSIYFDNLKQQGSLIVNTKEKNVYKVLNQNFKISKKDIIDLNPLQYKNKNTILYVVILHNNLKKNITKILQDNLNKKILISSRLLFYSLQHIDLDNFDMYTSIKNYYKNHSFKFDNNLIFYNDTTKEILKFSLNDIIEGLCGLVEIGSKIKCYI